MIVELFGLPASGKSTLARSFEKEGAIRIRDLSRTRIITHNVLFLFRHPVRFLSLSIAVRHAPPKLKWYSFVNLVLMHNAKWIEARRVSRQGKIALIDQGHFQILLSLFNVAPNEKDLHTYVALFPKPDVLFVISLSKEERESRLLGREWRPRAEFGKLEIIRAGQVGESMYETFLRILPTLGVPHEIISGSEETSLKTLSASNISYITSARMPTEKAHGVSIAHMCSAFGRAGSRVSLIVPTRHLSTQESVWSYYDVPKNFEFKRVYAPDFIRRGFTHPLFFFIQRLCFAVAVSRRAISWGVVYTREPEIAWTFSSSHRVVFEAHNWPSGWRGKVQAYLVRRSNLVVCNSAGTAEAARVFGVPHSIVSPNGFSPEQFSQKESREDARKRLGILADEKVALYIGALDERKGARTLFESAAFLPSHSVVVIGGTAGEVENLSQTFQKIRFLGYRPYKEIASNLSVADVLVLPNTALSQESSSFTSPIKLFAYMASGIPIVATRVPALTAFLNEKNAVLVPPDNPRLLAEGIEGVFKSPHSFGMLGEIARRDVEAYTWGARAHRILESIL